MYALQCALSQTSHIQVARQWGDRCHSSSLPRSVRAASFSRGCGTQERNGVGGECAIQESVRQSRTARLVVNVRHDELIGARPWESAFPQTEGEKKIALTLAIEYKRISRSKKANTNSAASTDRETEVVRNRRKEKGREGGRKRERERERGRVERRKERDKRRKREIERS